MSGLLAPALVSSQTATFSVESVISSRVRLFQRIQALTGGEKWWLTKTMGRRQE